MEGDRALIDPLGVIGPRAAPDGLSAIGHPVVLEPRAAVIWRPGLDNSRVPADIGSGCPR